MDINVFFLVNVILVLSIFAIFKLRKLLKSPSRSGWQTIKYFLLMFIISMPLTGVIMMILNRLVKYEIIPIYPNPFETGDAFIMAIHAAIVVVGMVIWFIKKSPETA